MRGLTVVVSEFVHRMSERCWRRVGSNRCAESKIIEVCVTSARGKQPDFCANPDARLRQEVIREVHPGITGIRVTEIAASTFPHSYA